jgi:hypothetical protein
MENVPYIVHEAAMARLERTIKRLWILCIIMFLAFVLSNGAWIYYESQWQTIDETTEQTVLQHGSDNQFIGGDFYGAAGSTD